MDGISRWLTFWFLLWNHISLPVTIEFINLPSCAVRAVLRNWTNNERHPLASIYTALKSLHFESFPWLLNGWKWLILCLATCLQHHHFKPWKPLWTPMHTMAKTIKKFKLIRSKRFIDSKSINTSTQQFVASVGVQFQVISIVSISNSWYLT